jgi:xylonate dehydratase
VDLMVSDEEIARRHENLKSAPIRNDSPWQELYRANVGQLSTGACLDFAVKYRDIRKVVPRHSH